MTTMQMAAEPTTNVNHLHSCQTPLAVNCRERATHLVTILEPGMHIEPVAIEVCEWHAAELIDGGMADGLDLVR